MWIFVGILAGSIIVSQHDTEEACKGRKAVMQDRKDAPVYGQCVRIDPLPGFSTIGTIRNGVFTAQ